MHITSLILAGTHNDEILDSNLQQCYPFVLYLTYRGNIHNALLKANSCEQHKEMKLLCLVKCCIRNFSLHSRVILSARDMIDT